MLSKMLSAVRCGGLASRLGLSQAACRRTWQPKAATYFRFEPMDACSASAPFSTGPSPDGGQGLHDQDGSSSITEEELRERNSRAVKAWLEANLGPEKMRIARILKDHHVLVRGGAEQGQKLIDALLEWKAESTISRRDE